MHQIFTSGCVSQSPARSSVFIFLHYLKIFPFYFFILHYKCVHVLFILFFLAFVGACSFLKLPLFDLFQVESLYLEQYVRSECIIFFNFLSLSSMLPPFLAEPTPTTVVGDWSFAFVQARELRWTECPCLQVVMYWCYELISKLLFCS